jgi:cobalt/nickel transport protein
MMKLNWSNKWTIALIVLIIASPIGILLVWNYGDAWGEWGEVGDWTPNSYWTAPLPDYNFDGWEDQMAASMGYILSAVIGVFVIIIVTYLMFNYVAKKNEKS